MEAVIAKANVVTRNGTMYSPEALEKAIDYAKIRSDKNEMINRFNFAVRHNSQNTIIELTLKTVHGA